MTCPEQCKRIPFCLTCLERSTPDAYGVYAFWFRNYCIYVGKAEKQTIRKRLIDHWIGSHNDDLRLWIYAKRDRLAICFRIVESLSKVAAYERYYIRKYQPLTNKVRFK
jgi:hypothetical protein